MGIIKNRFSLTVSIPREQKDEFTNTLNYINYFRIKNLSILLLLVMCAIIYTDISAKDHGLWNQIQGYRWLFYSHLVILITMFSLLSFLWIIKFTSLINFDMWYKFSTIFFALFGTIMGAATSINDQLIHGEITVYVITSLSIAVILYLRPFKSFIIYLISYIVFIIGVTKVQVNYNILRGHYINGTLVIILAWFLSVVLYNMKAQDFLKEKTIERQKDELQTTNAELINSNEQLHFSLRALDETQNMIFSLTLALESKDPYTHGHSERVAEYSIEIARCLGLSEKLQENLWRAAILHDIGKIGIPDAILNKPGLLTNEEWPIMKSHPERGENICSKLNFAREILPIIRYHHERYDGQGYPDGLKGESIPFLARIISISDAVDAITSERSYRSPRTFDIAISELKKGAGTQFDPVLVKKFVELYEQGKLAPKKESVPISN